ncbi:type IV pili twitching motility protein PilT [Candidatus Parcubacteria bacterium]|nr:MAG: type IV pili twitching motility protein PilT [Candidatus Parcubacteria bacterium]
MLEISNYFKKAIEQKASDLHLVEGSIPSLRVAGNLVKVDDKPIRKGELKEGVFKYLDNHEQERFERKRDIDVSLTFFEISFRVNIHYQEGRVGLAARLVPDKVPSPQEINLDEMLYKLTHLRDGLILVTGPAGVGKSTTLAVMLDIINQERASHIITIEDPIEYTFQDKKSIVEQRQLGRDTHSFSSALKYVLRQDPNVIMVGEMRDAETVAAVLNAAKTGHLVLSTLHTSTAAETIERIIDFYPAEYQSMIAHQLASLLRAVVSQQLLPKIGGGQVCAREILINNNAIANIIRSMQMEQINSFMQTSKSQGMITMNKYVEFLYRKGIISKETYDNRKRDIDNKSVYY